jgi:hypothetical protein
MMLCKVAKQLTVAFCPFCAFCIKALASIVHHGQAIPHGIKQAKRTFAIA